MQQSNTSKFNELIPQALQQTLYTKISNVQKAKSFISATLPLTSRHIKGQWGNPRATAGMDSIPCEISSVKGI